jgi:ATP-dependent Clp protease ATP-binding subunit ClpC
MFERYTEKARRVVFSARYQATALGDPEIKAIHFLLGLLREAKALFFKLELPEGKLEALRTACVKESLGGESIPTSVDMAVDEETKMILSRAVEEADSRKDNEVDVEHLLLGALHVPNKAKDIFRENGITYEKVSAQLRRGASPLGDALDST